MENVYTSIEELTQAELELIQQKRAEKQAHEDARIAKEKQRELELKMKDEAIRTKKLNMIADLRSADTNNILFQTVDGGDDRFFFKFNKDVYEVYIREHIVYGSGYRGNSRGMKYLLSDSFNNYTNRYYKNAKSVITKITEFKNQYEAKQRELNRELTLKNKAEKILTDRYPNHTINHSNSYTSSQRSGYRPNLFIVKSQNGTIEFTYYRSEDEILFNIYSTKIGQSIKDKVVDLILG